MGVSVTISSKDSFFSQDQSWELEGLSISEIKALGNLSLFKTTKLGLLCSVRCPASLILRTHDYLMSSKASSTVISGFHSPGEKEGLRVLLKKDVPAIICSTLPAQRLKIPLSTEKHFEKGRLLALSIFPKPYKTFTERLAYRRNKFVAVLADNMLIPFADKQSKTLELVRFMISKGKRVVAFNVPENGHLFRLGVEKIS